MSTNGAAVESVTEIAPEGRRTTALVLRPQSIVKASVNVQQAKKEWDNYVKLCQAILEEQDYIYFVRYIKNDGYEGKPIGFRRKADAEEKARQMKAVGSVSGVEIGQSKKRSAWDKLAKFYNLTLPSSPAGADPNIKVDVFMVGESIVERRSGDGFTLIIYQHADDLEIIKATATVVVSSPNGRTAVGEGVCSVKERNKGADGFAHADHDIPSTAFTRALNRAISRCIGTGEVSADEIEGETPASAQPAAQLPEVAKAPDVQALPAVPSSRPGERTEAIPQQAAPVAETPKTAETSSASPQAVSGESQGTAETQQSIIPSSPAEPPAASGAPLTPERVAERLGATVVETKDAETVRKALGNRINVIVREILPKTDLKNIGANVQSFIKICADIPSTASPKQVPTAKLQAIVSLMEQRLSKDGPSGLAAMISERNKQGRSAS